MLTSIYWNILVFAHARDHGLVERRPPAGPIWRKACKTERAVNDRLGGRLVNRAGPSRMNGGRVPHAPASGHGRTLGPRLCSTAIWGAPETNPNLCAERLG